MNFQLVWKILPGLRGLSCSDFRATPTDDPNNEKGVAFECGTQTKCDAFMRELETHFGPQRFSNNATAFETVKAYVVARSL